jgi:hypothetical protein
MAEKEFFNHNDVLVTQSRVVVGSSTYPVNSLSAVHLTHDKIPQISRGFWILLSLGIAIFMMSFSYLSATGDFLLFFLGCIISFCLTLYAFALNESISSYNVVFYTSGTNIQAYSSRDKKEIEDIVNAINEAIIARG